MNDNEAVVNPQKTKKSPDIGPLAVMAATRPDLCGLIMDPSNESELWNIEEFDYGEGCEE